MVYASKGAVAKTATEQVQSIIKSASTNTIALFILHLLLQIQLAVKQIVLQSIHSGTDGSQCPEGYKQLCGYAPF